VAATNRDLPAEVANGRFREDLLYRLNAHVIPVPPLRDRRSDIPALAAALLAATCERFGVRPKRLSDGALRLLLAYDWRRNNVRELRNVLERLVIETEGDIVSPDDVPADVVTEGGHEAESPTHTYQERKLEAERGIVVEALERNDWHVTRTAQELGLADHASLLKIMRRLHISRG